MSEESDFPIFLFHVSEIEDKESETGTVTIPVMRLWLTKDEFYDLNPDQMFSALDVEKGEKKKITSVEIFNNEDSRIMRLKCDFEKGLCIYYISKENVDKFQSVDNIEEEGCVEIEFLRDCFAEFLVLYGKWVEANIGDEE